MVERLVSAPGVPKAEMEGEVEAALDAETLVSRLKEFTEIARVDLLHDAAEASSNSENVIEGCLNGLLNVRHEIELDENLFVSLDPENSDSAQLHSDIRVLEYSVKLSSPMHPKSRSFPSCSLPFLEPLLCPFSLITVPSLPTPTRRQAVIPHVSQGHEEPQRNPPYSSEAAPACGLLNPPSLFAKPTGAAPHQRTQARGPSLVARQRLARGKPCLPVARLNRVALQRGSLRHLPPCAVRRPTTCELPPEPLHRL
ncbi:hypothetical protein Taro_008434 [Colocasia esculenta]|uniref:Uncharacterized protein n=1 Tax=Colocasia esculenta TaxID=4460 RepID=A0A843TX72_COLES|nr:hypothetical protein [Colocasia esculenta]